MNPVSSGSQQSFPRHGQPTQQELRVQQDLLQKRHIQQQTQLHVQGEQVLIQQRRQQQQMIQRPQMHQTVTTSQQMHQTVPTSQQMHQTVPTSQQMHQTVPTSQQTYPAASTSQQMHQSAPSSQNIDPSTSQQMHHFCPKTQQMKQAGDIEQKQHTHNVQTNDGELHMDQNTAELQHNDVTQQEGDQSHITDITNQQIPTEKFSDLHVTIHQEIEMDQITEEQLQQGVQHGDSYKPTTSAYLTHPNPPQGKLYFAIF